MSLRNIDLNITNATNQTAMIKLYSLLGTLGFGLQFLTIIKADK